MTSFLTRFVERDTLANSYNSFFGRTDVIDRIRSLPKGTGEREEAAVDEYCKSLREICGFEYVSQAVIMDVSKEKIRYYFVFATNSLHGIQVFKDAEAKAAEVQDQVRYQTKVEKQDQFGLPFGGPIPKSSKVKKLHERYIHFAREKVIQALTRHRTLNMSYEALYGEVMALPLVTESDLYHILLDLHPNVRLQLVGHRRTKPMLFRGDSVVIDSRNFTRSGN
jgi:hypothetical protein